MTKTLCLIMRLLSLLVGVVVANQQALAALECSGLSDSQSDGIDLTSIDSPSCTNQCSTLNGEPLGPSTWLDLDSPYDTAVVYFGDPGW